MNAALVEERLRAFYAKHNPGNDQNIAEIVRKFAGRERQLCSKLFKKSRILLQCHVPEAIQGVLQTPKQQLKLPVATAYPLDNIQKCRHLLPESDANRQTLVARPKKASPSAAETKAASVKKAPASATLSLFDQLADTYLDGPFRVLRHCFLERMRVFVVIRRINSSSQQRIGGAIAEYLLVLVELDASPSPAFKRMENGDGAKLQQHPPTEDASERA
ncbi:hypothetical protein PC118_g1012 [Phytophthora cactorum]|uniref:Uncharacterized protein n=1 Tax=Phytophthora cactorum TaxID=29920 RepID=A0A8T0ZYS1_9STRA|nr:hypothetical protein PC113_g1435 [Phytophthora cactorum]KAG2999034.1 hypothetical protein PC118_g1012 [Phytophthora cactorum]KAG3014836.1 hypothetical protein PC119_g12001 [Phytophthora cactorum]KAG3017605.1 hypothetical protein PC120_g10929 [Phytophthora cactorum]